MEYITNIQGWYSYRDDFKNSDPNPTTYELLQPFGGGTAPYAQPTVYYNGGASSTAVSYTHLFRYWLCERYNGHFFGLHSGYAFYNISGVRIPFQSKSTKDHRYHPSWLRKGM